MKVSLKVWGSGLLLLLVGIVVDVRTENKEEWCDFIVVGAGTSSLGLAARLAEVPFWKVCVFERGPVERRMSSWYTNEYEFTSPHDPLWLTKPTLQTLVRKGKYWSNVNKDGRLIYIPRFRGRGGTSRVYAAIVRRASPAVLDLWPNGWKHEDMTHYYKKLEDHYCYYDFENVTGITKEECQKWHGKGGPMQVNSQVQEAFQNFPRTMKYLCEDNKKPWNGYKNDYNGPEKDRISCSVFQQYKIRTENRENRASQTARGSSYTGYYENKRIKPYLVVSAPVSKIVFDKQGKAVGVSYWNKTGKTETKFARIEVILGGGSFDTPHLLQVSGVGPKKLLEKIGVHSIVTNNEHVGEHLWDHISVPYVLELSKKSTELCCTTETDPVPKVNIDGKIYKTSDLDSINGQFSWIFHYRSNITRVPKEMSDIQLYVMGNSKTFSETGALCTLKPPEYDDDDDDKDDDDKKESTIQGTISIIDQWPEYRGSVKSVTPHFFDKPEIEYGWSYTKDGVPSEEFKKVSQLFREQIKLLREMFFGNNVTKELKSLVIDEVTPGRNIDTDDKLDAWMRGTLVSAYHPVGTCKMPECADEFLRVKGVSNLRVCDASAFATQIDGNPAATLFAMGEKLADMLKFEYLKHIGVVIRKEFSTPASEFTNEYKSNIESINSMFKNECFDVTFSTEWVSTGRDTSFLIYKWSIICDYRKNERKVADELIKATPALMGTDYCKSDGFPEFNRVEATMNDLEHAPRHKVSPYVFLLGCRGFTGVSSDDLWKKVGSWGLYSNRVLGSKNCYKLNCEEEMCSVLKFVNDEDRELIYEEINTNLPLKDYVSTMKVVSRGKNSSALFLTSSMIANPGTDWFKDIAFYLLERAYSSSGHRYATQYPPLQDQPGWWTELRGGLLIYQPNSRLYSKTSIAAFDLDGTIIKTKSGKKFPLDEDDWIFASDEVVKKLKDNHDHRIKNVIMTNQAGIGLGQQSKLQWMDKIEAITRRLNVPIYVIAAIEYNENRKPNKGMWEYYNCTLNGFKTIDMATAVYVGDSAGRPGDLSDSDKKFAEGLKISFKTPEEYFGIKHEHTDL